MPVPRSRRLCWRIIISLPGGLDDSDALLEVLVPRQAGQGLRLRPQPRLEAHPLARHPLVNLPAVAWVFDKSQPHGWIDLKLTANGATAVLHASDKKHPKNGERLELKWRSERKG